VSNWTAVRDLPIVAARDHFGQATVYTPALTGVPASIEAPFDAAYEEVIVEDGVPITAQRPMLDLRLADLAARPLAGDTYTVAGQTYEVTDVQYDGHGSAKCYGVEA
jgi:hypothetical protein